MASDTSKLTVQRKDAVKSRELHFHLGAMDVEKNLSTLIGKLKIDWLDFPVNDILQQFTTLKGGILRGVFKQKAARAWFGCRAEKTQVTVLLPGNCSLSEWSEKVDCMPHSWPKSFHIGKMCEASRPIYLPRSLAEPYVPEPNEVPGLRFKIQT